MFKKVFFLTLSSVLVFSAMHAQAKLYYTKTGKITFFSQAKLEDIEAKNNTATVMLNTETGATEFAVQINGFEFEKKAMQEHFNDNYLESSQFPKSEFKGQILNNKDVNYKKDGNYPVNVSGKLTIHGVTKDVATTGSVKVSGGKIGLSSVFYVALADYNIKSLKDKIADKIKITVDCGLEEFKK